MTDQSPSLQSVHQKVLDDKREEAQLNDEALPKLVLKDSKPLSPKHSRSMSDSFGRAKDNHEPMQRSLSDGRMKNSGTIELQPRTSQIQHRISVDEMMDDDVLTDDEDGKMMELSHRSNSGIGHEMQNHQLLGNDDEMSSDDEDDSSVNSDGDGVQNDDEDDPFDTIRGKMATLPQQMERTDPKVVKRAVLDGAFKYPAKMFASPVGATRPFAFLSLVRSSHAGVHSNWKEPLGKGAFGADAAKNYTTTVNVMSDIFVAATVFGVLNNGYQSVKGKFTDQAAVKHHEFMRDDFQPVMTRMSQMEAVATLRDNAFDAKLILENADIAQDIQDMDLDGDLEGELLELVDDVKNNIPDDLSDKEATRTALDKLTQLINKLDGVDEADEMKANLMKIRDTINVYSPDFDNALKNKFEEDIAQEKLGTTSKFVIEDLMPQLLKQDSKAAIKEFRGLDSDQIRQALPELDGQLDQFITDLETAQRTARNAMSRDQDRATLQNQIQALKVTLANVDTEASRELTAKLDKLSDNLAAHHQMREILDGDGDEVQKHMRVVNEVLPGMADSAVGGQTKLMAHYANMMIGLQTDDGPENIRDALRQGAMEASEDREVDQLSDIGNIAQDTKNLRKKMEKADVEAKLAQVKAESSIRTLDARGGFMRRFFPDKKESWASLGIDTAGTVVDASYSHLAYLSKGWEAAANSAGAAIAGVAIYSVKAGFDGVKAIQHQTQVVHARKEASQSGDEAGRQGGQLRDAFDKINNQHAEVFNDNGLSDEALDVSEIRKPVEKSRAIREQILPKVRTEILPKLEAELAEANETLEEELSGSQPHNDAKAKKEKLEKQIKLLKQLDEAGKGQIKNRTQEAIARHEKIVAKRKRQDRIGKTLTDVGAVGIFTTLLSGGYAAPVGFAMMAVGGGTGAVVRLNHHYRGNIISSEGQRLGNTGANTGDELRLNKLGAKLVDSQADHAKLEQKSAFKGMFYKMRHKGKVEAAKDQNVQQAKITRDNFQSPEARRLLLTSYMAHHNADETMQFMKDFYGLKEDKLRQIEPQLRTLDTAKDMMMDQDGSVERNAPLQNALMSTAIYLAERIEHHRK